MLDHFAFNDGVDDIAQAGVLLEQILAGLEAGPRIHREHASDEGPAIGIDHAIALKDVADVGHAGTRRNVDDLVFRERPFGLDRLLSIKEESADPQHGDDQEGHDRVADHDESVARAPRMLRRLRHLLRLKRRARTARSNGWSLAHRSNLIPASRLVSLIQYSTRVREINYVRMRQKVENGSASPSAQNLSAQIFWPKSFGRRLLSHAPQPVLRNRSNAV